jgi:hypothetical protein
MGRGVDSADREQPNNRRLKIVNIIIFMEGVE